MTKDLVIVHLYPDLLRTYGDRGNVIALQRHGEWRGLAVEVRGVSCGERLPRRCHVIVAGGGSDRVQQVVASDLVDRRTELCEAAARGSILLGICGGYQLLGRSYVTADGVVIEGAGLLDVTTVPGQAGSPAGSGPG